MCTHYNPNHSDEKLDALQVEYFPLAEASCVRMIFAEEGTSYNLTKDGVSIL